jgi:hypothetical protein
MKGWGIYIVVALAYFAYNVMTSADRDSTGAIVGEGSVDAFELRTGDCFDDNESLYGSEIDSLPGVPCSEPHDNEVYAVVAIDLPEFPGNDAMGDLAMDKCMGQFASFVGRDYESSSLDIYTLYPSEESWRQSDREVVCALYDMELNKLQGSVRDRGI